MPPAPAVMLRLIHHYRSLHCFLDCGCRLLLRFTSHAISSPFNFAGNFPSFVSESFRCARRERPADGGSNQGTAGSR